MSTIINNECTAYNLLFLETNSRLVIKNYRKSVCNYFLQSTNWYCFKKHKEHWEYGVSYSDLNYLLKHNMVGNIPVPIEITSIYDLKLVE